MSDVIVGLIFDTSIDLSDQWRTVTTRYLSSLFTRLHEGRTDDSFNISIVTYGPTDYYPMPILGKRYFNNMSLVFPELKDDPSNLGIGQTSSGGKSGMAALEGYAAMLEMFDLFLTSHRSAKDAGHDKPLDVLPSPLCHLIHVTACPPDESRHPVWNQTTSLDMLSWKNLPDELRKRNINLSMILLNPNKSLAELHSLANPEPSKAWFDASIEGHALLLSSQASWAQLATKRVAEGLETEKSTETKRARVSISKETPVAPPAQVAVLQRPTESGVPSGTGQPNPLAATLTRNAFAQLQQAMIKLREIEPSLRQHHEQIELLRQQGRMQDMENLKRAIQPKMQMYITLKRLITEQKAKATAASAPVEPTKAVETRPQNVAGTSRQNRPAAIGPANDNSAQPVQVQTNPMQGVGQFMQAQQPRPSTAVPDSRPPVNILPHFSPSVAAQMQKLQMKEGIQGQTSVSSGPVQQVQPLSHNSMNQSVQPGANVPQTKPPAIGENNIWVGTFSWLNPQSLQPMEAHVQLMSMSVIQPQLWPPKFEVEVLKDLAVPVPVLKEWINQHKPAMCQIRPSTRPSGQQENVHRFKGLSTLLVERNVYALGRRAPASENDKAMLLIFNMGGDGSLLLAAAFPETGVPEQPRANPPAAPVNRPNPIGLLFNPNTTQQQKAAIFQNLPPELRMQVMALAAKQKQQIQAQQAAAGASGVNSNPTNPNAFANPQPGAWPGGNPSGGINLTGLMGGNLAQALAAMQQQRQNGMPPPPGSGGPGPL